MRPDPHVFVPDPDQPRDRTGRRVCRDCGLVGRPDDGHHATPEQAEVCATSNEVARGV